MAQKSWHIKRRTYLRGACGIALGLPFLEAMSKDVENKPHKAKPKRLLCVYQPYGVCMQKNEWGWFPTKEGKDYTFSNPLKPLEPHRDDISILSGMSHKNGWKMGGHDTADIFLTGGHIHGKINDNSISLDQKVAEAIGSQTRYPSLVLSTSSGIGKVGRSYTLSYNHLGKPIPAQNNVKLIYNRLFKVVTEEEKKQVKSSRSLLDNVLVHANYLHKSLSRFDQIKMEEYLDTLRHTEQQIERSQAWLDLPKPKIDSDVIDVSIDAGSIQAYFKTLYDLIFLAFQTDSTRVASYMLSPMDGSIVQTLPKLLGFKIGTHHSIAHKDHIEHGKLNQYFIQDLVQFLDKLKSAKEGDSNMLDNTAVLFGSSNSKTHNNKNYPLVLAGGKNMGFKHGAYHKISESVPLSNLFVNILHKLDVKVDQFRDSTGHLSDHLV